MPIDVRCQMIMLAVALILGALTLTMTETVTACGCMSSRSSDRDQFRLALCIEEYWSDYGVPPVTDTESTWFEKLATSGHVEVEMFNVAGSSPRRYPIDWKYNQPIAFDAHASSPQLVIIRYTGPNGVDDGGTLDDWDAYSEPNLGYWYKEDWPWLYWRGSLCTTIGLIVIGLTVWRPRTARGRIHLALFEAGLLMAIVVPLSFGIEPRNCYPSPLPDWVTGLAAFGFIPIGLAVLASFFNAWSRLARAVPVRSDLCRVCGYDLRGTPSGRCPECGERNTPPNGGPSVSPGTDGREARSIGMNTLDRAL